MAIKIDPANKNGKAVINAHPPNIQVMSPPPSPIRTIIVKIKKFRSARCRSFRVLVGLLAIIFVISMPYCCAEVMEKF